MKKHVVVLAGLLAINPGTLYAVDGGTVTVVDCQSMTRAVAPVSEVAGVELGFAGEISKATLTEVGSKDTREVALTKGAALFEGVHAGTWSACQTGDVQAVAITLKTKSGGEVLGALSAAGLAAGGLALGMQGGGSDGAASGAETVASANREVLAYNREPVPTDRGNRVDVVDRPKVTDSDDCVFPMAGAAAGGCRENESPAPLSPFS
jgi:hypothetical protein